MYELKHAFEDRFERKQNSLTGLACMIGREDGEIEIEGRPNYIYVRTPDGAVAEVYNNRVANKLDLHVIIGYDPLQPNLLQVLTTRNVSRTIDDGQTVISIPKHGTTHEWPNDDAVFIHITQLRGFRVGRSSGFVIACDGGVCWVNAAWTKVAATTLDLGIYKPTNPGKAKIVLVYVNTTGVISVQDGAETDLQLLRLVDIPEAADAAYYLAAVRLYTDQVQIVVSREYTDIMDLRWLPRAGKGAAVATTTLIDSLTGETVVDSETSEIVYAEV